ncbi:hypothetical protein [Chamaesiphon sp. VAR_48_metabat_135_sub]|uniref:hypothetical protein n=1 Tax=Chamaesiphon sp. VAR_48_metabat_135_sub TaxID=2964699 RepID=UPI00286B4314|nr:hypothetical protein [Chamaesiphon sp. VAR_48_metabat_135_sub]
MSAPSTPPLPIPIVPPSVLVSLAAIPWLATIVTVRAASGFLEQVGLVSEEIFRGDRLPVLHLPIDETASTDRESRSQRLRQSD